MINGTDYGPMAFGFDEFVGCVVGWTANGITSVERYPILEMRGSPSEKLNLIERARDFDYLFPRDDG